MTLRSTRSEQGFALVAAIIIMSIMMILGLAIFAYSNGQTRQTRLERVGESAFNLAERALEEQTFKLSRSWPGAESTAYPGPTDPADGSGCTPTSTIAICPASTELISSGDTPDASAGTTWTTIVRDNGDTDPTTDNTGENFYSSALVDGLPSWDANKDGYVWVKATGTVREKTRTLVAKVKVESLPLPFPKASIIANTLYLSNNGNKTIVDTNGTNDGDVGPILLGCPTSPNPTDCIVSNNGQPYDPTTDPRISPPSFGPAPPTILSAQLQAQLRDTAVANGTYYDTCPTDAQLTGEVVYIKTVPAGGCGYTINGGGNINAPDGPGIIVVEQSLGTLTLKGNLEFWGMLYFMNTTNSSDIVVELNGTITVHGSLQVEGHGAVKVGDSGDGGQGDANVTFDQSLSGQIKTYGKAGILQNSWRETH